MRASVSFLLLLLLAVGAARADFVTDINCFNSEYGCGDQVAVSIIVGGHSATCLCSNGTRLVLEGIYSANSTFEGVNTTFRADNGVVSAAGCPANLTWSQAASWAEPCNGAVDMSQQCSSACRAAVASDSVSRDCFYNFLANSFFGTPPPSRSTVDAFYTECTTPVPPPPPPPSAAPATAAASVLAIGATVAGAALLLA
ncbi:hypothetical protein ABPG77_008791 [Micractinium sp. CCAP 211/92]